MADSYDLKGVSVLTTIDDHAPDCRDLDRPRVANENLLVTKVISSTENSTVR